MLGIVFGLMGLCEFAGSYFIASSITSHRARAAEQAVTQANECKSRLEGLGYKANVNGDTISAEMTGLRDASYKLGQATMAVMSCQGWKLSRFCMGEGCGTAAGIQFDLQPAKPTIN
jgi:hypothetical protein